MKIPALSILALLLAASASQAQPPFGGPDDTAYADRLWQALTQAHLVGPNAIQSKAYPGQHPHGAVLQTIYTSLNLDGQDNRLIVKRNYGGDGVSTQSVAENPKRFLTAITIMYQRPGYDPVNGDWFWAKYLPDGSLDKNPAGMPLAGRVAKANPSAGCIACHRTAPGGDMIFTK